MAKDDLILNEKDRAKLDGIVSKMVANKESDADIQFVVNDFKNKYGLKKKEPTQSDLAAGESLSPSTEVKPPKVEAADETPVKPVSFLDRYKVESSTDKYKNLVPKSEVPITYEKVKPEVATKLKRDIETKAWEGVKENVAKSGAVNTNELFDINSDIYAKINLDEDQLKEYNFLKSIRDADQEIKSFTEALKIYPNPAMQMSLNESIATKAAQELAYAKYQKEKYKAIDDEIAYNQNIINNSTTPAVIAIRKAKIQELKAQKENFFKDSNEIVAKQYNQNEVDINAFKVPGDTPKEKLQNYYLMLNERERQLWKQLNPSDSENVNALRFISYALPSQISQLIPGANPDLFDKYIEITKKIKAISPAVLINRNPVKDVNEGFFESFGKSAAKVLVPSSERYITTPFELSSQIKESISLAGIPENAISQETGKILTTESKAPEAFSNEWWGNIAGTSAGMIPYFAAGSELVKGLSGLGKFPVYQRYLQGTKYGKYLVSQPVMTGLGYKAAGYIMPANSDVLSEATFLSGFLGGVVMKGVDKVINTEYMAKIFNNLFGKDAERMAIMVSKVGERVSLGLGEYGEEVGNTLGTMIDTYMMSKDFDRLKKDFTDNFGTMDKNLELFVASFTMGAIMGTGTGYGKASANRSKDFYNSLSAEDKKKADSFVQRVTRERYNAMVAAKKAEIKTSGAKVQPVTPKDLTDRLDAIKVLSSTESTPQDKSAALSVLADIDLKIENDKIAKTAEAELKAGDTSTEVKPEDATIEPIPSAEGTITTSEGTVEPASIETQKADIEKRRKEEIDRVTQAPSAEVIDEEGNVINTSEQIAEINAKYDAELNDLNATIAAEESASKSTEGKTVAKEKAAKPTAEAKPLTEGDQVQLEPQMKGGMPRIMEFKNGTWQQKVGNEYTTVSKEVQQEAQNLYDSQNEQGVSSEVGVGQEPVKTEPIERGGKEAPSPSGNVQAPKKVKESGEFVVQGTFNGHQVIAGNKQFEVADYRQIGQQGKTELVENEKDGKKIFTLITPHNDYVGRRGYMGVSLVLPSNTTKTKAEIESILKDKTAEVKSNLDKNIPGRLNKPVDMKYEGETLVPVVNESKTTPPPISTQTIEVKGPPIVVEETKAPQEEVSQEAPQEVTKPSLVTPEVLSNFIDTGKVNDDVLTSIAEKIKNNEALTNDENTIFSGNVSKINNILTDLRKEAGTVELKAMEMANKNVVKFLQKLGVSVNILNTQEEFDQAAKEEGVKAGRGAEGFFIDTSGKIYINKSVLEKGWAKTVLYHEATHPIINIIRNTNPEKYKALVNGLKELAKTNENVRDAINWVNDKYKNDPKGTIEDESVVEVIARIASGKIPFGQINPTLREKIIDFMNQILRALGRKEITPKTDTETFKKAAREIAYAMREGKSAAKIVGEENVKQYESDGLIIGVNNGQFRLSSKNKTEKKPNKKKKIARPFDDLLIEYVDIDQYDGKDAVGFLGDKQVVGDVKSPTGVKLNGRGGPFYPVWANQKELKNLQAGNVSIIKDGKVWATTDEDGANRLLSALKRGSIAAIGTQAPEGILGNKMMLEHYAMLLNNALKSFDSVINDSNSSKESKAKAETDKKDLIVAMNNPLDTNYKPGITFRDKIISSLNAIKNGNASTEAQKKNATKLLGTFKEGRFNSVKELYDIMYELSYEVRTGYFKKIFNIGNSNRFNLPSIISGANYKYDQTIPEYANDPVFESAEYGDIVGFVEYDPETLRIVKTKDKEDPFHHGSYHYTIVGDIKGVKYFNNAIDGRAIFYESKPVGEGEGINQTQFGLREKPQAARGIMGAMPSNKVNAEKIKARQEAYKEGKIPQFSKGGRDLVEPSSEKWKPSLTEAQVDEATNGAYTENLKKKEAEGAAHATQITTTRETYKKWAEWMETNIPNIDNARILDIGAGFGHIHKQFDNILGIETESYEPFYNTEKYQEHAGKSKPDYVKMDGSDIPKGKFDVVVNNAVLNVVPRDIRDNVVIAIGDAMKPGGMGIINAMSASYTKDQIAKIDEGRSSNLKLSDSEVFTNQGGKFTYQKGFTTPELVAYVQDVLGPDFTVKPAPKEITSMTTVVVEKKGKAQASKGDRNLAPNGKPSNLNDVQYKQVRTPEFKAWFGDWENDPKNASKIVDENGEPLVVYHGSPKFFDEFNLSTMGELGSGIYLTANKSEANKYAYMSDSETPNVYELFANIKNPFIIKKGAEQFWKKFGVDTSSDNEATQAMIDAGYDGIMLSAPETVRDVFTRKSIKTGETKNHFLAINPNQIKSATENIGTFSKEDNRIQYSKGGREKIMVNGSPATVVSMPDSLNIIDGFYSPIEKRILEFKQPKASATKWKEQVGTKKDEAVFSGIADWLNTFKPDQQISKEEVLNFIRNNRIEIKQIVKQEKEGLINMNKPRHEIYSLEGSKSDYKETLILLPNKAKESLVSRVRSINERLNRIDDLLTDTRTYKKVGNTGTISDFELEVTDQEAYDRLTEERDRLKKEADANREKIKQLKEGEFYSTRHYDEPDILVHIRTDVRTNKNGEKVFFIEEVQSDWGQQGREVGFDLNKKYKAARSVYFNYQRFKLGEITAAEAKANEKKISEDSGFSLSELYDEAEVWGDFTKEPKNISKAPYVADTNAWTKLGLKTALQQAVEAGATKLAWTTGQQQNERYDLRKRADRISYSVNKDGTYNVNASKDGVSVGAENNISPKELAGFLGKDLANRIINGEGSKSLSQSFDKDLTGDQLAFGGAGMKGYYGNTANPGILAKVMMSIIKDLTGKEGVVSDTEINVARWSPYQNYTPSAQPSIEITPELAAAVEEGVAQFSKGGRQSFMNGDASVVKGKDFDMEGEYDVFYQNEKIGRMYYDRSFKAWKNAEFDQYNQRPYTAEWIYGDVIGDTKAEAVKTFVDRHLENLSKTATKEFPRSFSPDPILDEYLNKLSEKGKLYVNPFNSREFIYNDVANLEINRFDKRDRREIVLQDISVFDKGKGQGKATLKDITEAADDLGMKITLDAQAFGIGGLKTKDLIKFYQNAGFKIDLTAYNGDFNTEQEMIDYVTEYEGEALPMYRNPVTTQYSKGNRDVKSTFSEATDLFYKIKNTDGSAKRKALADERKALMDRNPSVKFIDDNIKNVLDQLEAKEVATRKGNCP